MPRLRLLPGLALFALLGLAGLGSTGCNRVRVDDVRGPDATDWKRISCKRMDKRCFKAAAEMCPNGYYFAKASGSVPAAADSHVDEAAPAAATAGPSSGAHPQAGVNAKTLPPQERWGSGMYSNHEGTIIVQCAGAGAT